MVARVSKRWSGARFISALRSNAMQRNGLSSLSGLRSWDACRVGRVFRAAHGANLNREGWRERWRGVALSWYARVLTVRVTKCTFRSARAVVGLVAFRVCDQPSFGSGSVGRVVRVTPRAVWLVRSHSCHPENALESDGFVEIAFKGARTVVGLSGLWAFVSAAGCRIRVDMGEW